MSSKSLAHSLVKAHRPGNIALSWSSMTFTLLLVLFVALRFWHITAYSLWGGEAFSMIGVQQSWSDMITYIVADIVHPPLFYTLLKLWTIAGGDSLLFNLPSPLPSTVSVTRRRRLACSCLKERWPALIIRASGSILRGIRALTRSAAETSNYFQKMWTSV